MTTLPINSTIGSITTIAPDSIFVKGYAIGPSRIMSLELSIDDGITWTYVDLYIPHLLRLMCYMRVNAHGEVVCKATDEAGRTQEKEGQWNLRGVAYNAWGKGTW
jgi:sulfite oxidase